jgi:hypothetical protein
VAGDAEWSFISPSKRVRRRPIGGPGKHRCRAQRRSRFGWEVEEPNDALQCSHLRLPQTEGGVCVSTVSIVGDCGGDLPERARADEFGATVVGADIIGRSGLGLCPIVADAPGGADGVCERPMHPDDPLCSVAFTAEGNLDTQSPQEGLRAA